MKRRRVLVAVPSVAAEGAVEFVDRDSLRECSQICASLPVNATHKVEPFALYGRRFFVGFGSQSARLFLGFRRAEASYADPLSNRDTVASLRHGGRSRKDTAAITNQLECFDAIDTMDVCLSDDRVSFDVRVRWRQHPGPNTRASAANGTDVQHARG